MPIKGMSTKGMSREKWLEERQKSIGGSDAAAIVGLSKWSTPYSVWAEKTGRIPPKEETEAMRQGTDLEEYVAERFAEQTGKKVRRVPKILKNDAYPFAHANVDRLIVGENAGLECKTTSSLNTKRFKGVEFPIDYYAQCVHYLAVTGLQKWYLAVLVLGREFYTFELDRDESEIDALMGAEKAFWETNVITDTPPMIDGAEATAEALNGVFGDATQEETELFGRDGMIDTLNELKAQRKELDNAISEIENTLKADIGNAERGRAERYIVVWKPVERRTLDLPKLKAKYPDMDISDCYKTSTSRRFDVRKIETEE